MIHSAFYLPIESELHGPNIRKFKGNIVLCQAQSKIETFMIIKITENSTLTEFSSGIFNF